MVWNNNYCEWINLRFKNLIDQDRKRLGMKQGRTMEEQKDERCEYAKIIGDGLNEMIKARNVVVGEFLLEDLVQDLKPDTQRIEIENVARVIVTPTSVEIYTFEDHVHTIEISQAIWSKNFLGDIQ